MLSNFYIAMLLTFALLFCNNSHMNIRHDTRTMLKATGWTLSRLAKEAGVNASALSRYLGMKNPGQTIADKIYPFVATPRYPSSDNSPHPEAGG